jgi:hypothetical protein
MAKYKYQPDLDFQAISFGTPTGSDEWGEAAGRPYSLALDAWIKQSPGYFTLPQDLVVNVKRFHDGDKYKEIKKNETIIGILVQLDVRRDEMPNNPMIVAALYHFSIRSKKPRVSTIKKRAQDLVNKIKKTPKKKREAMLWRGFEQLAKNVFKIESPQGVYMDEWMRHSMRITGWQAVVALQWGENEDYDYPEKINLILNRIARGEEVIINKSDLETVDGKTRLKRAIRKAVKKKTVKKPVKKRSRVAKITKVAKRPAKRPAKKSAKRRPRRQNLLDSITEIIAEELESAAGELGMSIEEVTRQFVRTIMRRRRR